MKSFAYLIVLVALVAGVQSQSKQDSKITQMNHEQLRQDSMRQQQNADSMRQMNKEQNAAADNMLGSAYGAPRPIAQHGYAAVGPSYAAAPAPSYASVPAPPCPRNYLFSCQPSLTPAPCSQAASYGSAGAYSHYVPQYALPAAMTYEY